MLVCVRVWAHSCFCLLQHHGQLLIFVPYHPPSGLHDMSISLQQARATAAAAVPLSAAALHTYTLHVISRTVCAVDNKTPVLNTQLTVYYASLDLLQAQHSSGGLNTCLMMQEVLRQSSMPWAA